MVWKWCTAGVALSVECVAGVAVWCLVWNVLLHRCGSVVRVWNVWRVWQCGAEWNVVCRYGVSVECVTGAAV